MELDKPAILYSYSIDLKNADARFFVEEGAKVINAHLVQYYTGDNKERILARTPINSFKLKGLVSKLLQKNDYCFFVDCSGERILNNNRIAVAGIIMPQFEDQGPDIVSFNRACAIEIWNPSGTPEKCAWLALLDFFAKDTFKAGKSTAIVTDHDLGTHHKFNTRAEPFLNNFFLPPGVTLHYARDKGGNAYNSIMKDCDWLGKALLDFIEQGGKPPETLQSTPKAPFSHIRLWSESYLQKIGLVDY